jgi:hypothetical protein
MMANADSSYGTAYTVKVESGYLALRNAQAYDSSNEIGKLISGDTVYVSEAGSGTYWYVYSPKHGKYGYVNKNYLVYAGTAPAPGGDSSYGTAYTVKVESGYLALRNAQAYDSRNEIGKLYNGDTVYVSEAGSGTYWYVYSPKYGKYGYVNKNYLVYTDTALGQKSAPGSGPAYTVKVETGYLALRSAAAYDSNNEIGKLYSGDTVYVESAGSGTYWYVYAPKLDRSGYVNHNYLY